MQKYLVVEIKHTHYAKFLRLDKQDRSTLNLTTLVDNQKKAEVKIYIAGEGKKHLLQSFIVSPVPPGRAGEPRFLLSGSFDGRHSVELTLKVNGKKWETKHVSVKKYLKRGRPLLITGIAVGLIAAALLVWLLLRSCGPSAGEYERPTGAETGEAQPAAEAPVSEGPEVDGSATREESFPEEPAAEGPSPAEQSSTAEQPSPAEQPTAGGGETEEPERTAEGESTDGAADRDDIEERDGAKTARENEAPDETAEREGGTEVQAEEEAEVETVPVIIPEDTLIYFAPNSSSLTPAAREKLDALSNELSRAADALAETGDGDGSTALEITISGHCALYGTEKGRTELSRERAVNVKNYLESRGKLPDRSPDVIGKGGKEPVTRVEERQQLNRRVVISASKP